ncbi:hypothetical protein EVAR_41656_1 [Eumeta japonica]|uniref:Uncharacterized protein n=1 Tax=Eumeta variegata TaxID=151549 RepID=A0A4C1X3N8_EUMVA|nr:hypothetical protein EVAR_41656_1 [Eumeta japonica]
MSHRTREARRMPCVSHSTMIGLPRARELVHSLQMYCKLLNRISEVIFGSQQLSRARDLTAGVPPGRMSGRRAREPSRARPRPPTAPAGTEFHLSTENRFSLGKFGALLK